MKFNPSTFQPFNASTLVFSLLALPPERDKLFKGGILKANPSTRNASLPIVAFFDNRIRQLAEKVVAKVETLNPERSIGEI